MRSQAFQGSSVLMLVDFGAIIDGGVEARLSTFQFNFVVYIKKALCHFLFNGLRWLDWLFLISRWGQRGAHSAVVCRRGNTPASGSMLAPAWTHKGASFLGKLECFSFEIRHMSQSSCFLQTRFFMWSLKLIVALSVLALSHLFSCKKSLITK